MIVMRRNTAVIFILRLWGVGEMTCIFTFLEPVYFNYIKKAIKIIKYKKVPVLAAATCEGVHCGSGMKCRVRHGVPQCVCAPDCSQYRAQYGSGPVCGNDLRTYRNYCHLLKSNCRKNTFVEVNYPGRCKCEYRTVQNYFTGVNMSKYQYRFISRMYMCLSITV